MIESMKISSDKSTYSKWTNPSTLFYTILKYRWNSSGQMLDMALEKLIGKTWKIIWTINSVHIQTLTLIALEGLVLIPTSNRSLSFQT